MKDTTPDTEENEDRDICVKCKRVWEHCYCGQKDDTPETEWEKEE